MNTRIAKCIIIILQAMLLSTFHALGQYNYRPKKICIKDSILNIPVSFAVLFFEDQTTGKKKAIRSDINGNISPGMLPQSNRRVTISRFGYISKTITITDLKDIVWLEPESILLDEIMVKASTSAYAKRRIKNAFKNTRRFFISKDYCSDVYLLQTITESGIYTKFREAYLNIFNPNGYRNLRSNYETTEIVIDGNIRESNDYSKNLFQESLTDPEINIPNHYFTYDRCKYRPWLIEHLTDYKFAILDTIELAKDCQTLLISCKQIKDTIPQSANPYLFKKDYWCYLDVNTGCIRKLISTTKFCEQTSSFKRTFVRTAEVRYTNQINNNHLDHVEVLKVDILQSLQDSTPVIKDHVVYTKLKVFHIDQCVSGKKIRSAYLKYDPEFWKEKQIKSKIEHDLSQTEPLSEQFKNFQQF